MDDAEYLKLIARGETQHVEFKERPSGKNERKICAEIAAFASTGGGALFIGVADDAKIVGLSEDDAQILSAKLEGWIAELVQPQPKWSSDVRTFHGKRVLIVTVNAGVDPIHYYNGRPYHRVGTTSRPANAAEVKDRFLRWSIRDDMQRTVSGSTAAAIYGQGELATMSYDTIRDRLCEEFPILRQSQIGTS